MADRIDHLTIVGGGTAGWLAASMLFAAFNRRGDGPDLEITVIESPTVPIVGVGESSTALIRWTLDKLQIDEDDFIRGCDASPKAGVKFVDWNREPDTGAPISFYQLFEAPASIAGFFSGYHYHAARKAGRIDKPFSHAATGTPVLLDACRSPRKIDAEPFRGLVNYSYHFDAALLAGYLRDYATEMGVHHVLDDVVGVRRAADGGIAALQLKQRGEVPVEFVIDCTGFRSRLLHQELGEKFIPYGRHLLCDRALAIQYPTDQAAPIEPYTTSTALGAGWVWRVPLFTRIGAGYVFSSAFRTDDQAIAEFRDHLGPAADGSDISVIPMNIGRYQRGWVHNCLAIGLSGGFIEPLEATSLHFIQAAVRWFIANFPGAEIAPSLRDDYNRLVRNLYDEIRDFIVLYYCTSNRDDQPFWRAVRADDAIPDTLRERLALWRHRLPETMDLRNPSPMFDDWNYSLVLFGKRYFDDVTFAAESAVSHQDFEDFTRDVARRQQELLRQAPDNREFLRAIRERRSTPWYRSQPSAPPSEMREPVPGALL